MATYGPADCSVSLGGSPVPDITVIGAIDKEALIEETTPFGVAWEASTKVGVSKLAPVTFEAPQSTTAGNLTLVGDAAGIGGTLAVIITIGGAKTTSFSSIVQKITRTFTKGVLTKYSLTVQPTGTVTEA